MVKYTRLYTGADGESHFEDVEVPVKDPEGGGLGTEPMKADRVLFTQRNSAGPWHVAPRRQFLIISSGELNMEVWGGEKRRFLPGDILLAEDTTGRGHFTTAINLTSVVVPLA